MEFGAVLWTFGEQASPGFFERIHDAVDDAGFDVLVLGDHVAFPSRDAADVEYPAAASPPDHFHVSQNVYETFNVLSFLAGRDAGVRLGTNVCVAPYRHPVVLTKQVLTVTALTGGRFDLGVGAGWWRREFDLLDVPYEERGARLDEFLDLFGTVLEDPETGFDGPFHSFPETGFHPVPDPDDRPPVWIGGHSGAAFRRVGQFGDGWTGMGERPPAVSEAVDRMGHAWDDYDREGSPRVAVTRAVSFTDGGTDGDRPFVGSPESVRRDVERYRDAGVDRLVVDFFDADPDRQVATVERFGEEVIDVV